MSALDFAMLADYVPTDGGIAHLDAGGIDHIYVRDVPSGQNIGLLLRIEFRRNECDRPHAVEVLCQDEDGERLIRRRQRIRGDSRMAGLSYRSEEGS